MVMFSKMLLYETLFKKILKLNFSIYPIHEEEPQAQ